MVRPLRIEFPGAVYHLTSRGDRREDIFVDDGDREHLVEILGQVCGRLGWTVYAWCLMPNHYHILAETADANLSRGMRQLNGVYTQAYNRRHGRVGHVFQGRYKAILVQKEAHLFELCRYVVLNPVRSGLVGDVADWRWSSHASVMGTAPAPTWLDAAGLLAFFGGRRDRARRCYARFVQDGIAASSPWEGLRYQILLGDGAFIAETLGPPVLDAGQGIAGEIPKQQRRLLAEPVEIFRARYPERDEAMARAYLSGAHTMKAIAEAFGVHYMTVSRAVCKIEA